LKNGNKTALTPTTWIEDVQAITSYTQIATSQHLPPFLIDGDHRQRKP